MEGKFTGIVTTVIQDAAKPYAFIGLHTVRMLDGSIPTMLREMTIYDLFIHSDDCAAPLQEGMELRFEIHPDERRGEGHYRAKSAVETDKNKLDQLSKGGIELALQGYDGGRFIEHSSVLATWCISAALAAKVKEKTMGGKTVQLLLIQGHDSSSVGGFWYTERRQLIDLAAPMVHLSFNRPGLHRVFALIVWADTPNDLVNLYLSTSGSRYKTTVVSNEGISISLEEKPDARYSDERKIHFFGSGYIQAELPKTLFASPPWDWNWVNWMFSSKPRDQCAFRRRRFVAYTFQPLLAIPILYFVLALLWVLRLLIVAALLSVGKRGIDFDSIRRFRYPVKSIWRYVDGSVFKLKTKRTSVSLPLAISPAALLVCAFIATALVLFDRLGFYDWVRLFAYTFGGGLFVCVVVSLFQVWDASMDKRARELARKALEDERKRRALEAEAARLICSATGPKTPDVWQLPFGPRTVRFYAIALKQMVCRNYAG